MTRQQQTRAAHRSSRRRSGAGSLEYVLVFAVTTTIVAVGMVVFFGGFRQFVVQVATAFVDPRPAGKTENRNDSPGRPAQPDRQMRAGEAPPSDTAGFPVYLIGILLAVGLLGIIGLTNMRRRRNSRVPESVAESLAKPIVSEPLQIRAFGKRQQLWRAILTDGELLLRNGMEVRHLMTRVPLTVRPSATMEEIRYVMADSRVHHLLVCEGDHLLGIISDRDLCGCENRLARQIMRSPVHTVTGGTTLGIAIHTLIENNISCLPVLDAGRLCGILSTTDLVLTLQCSLQLWLRMAQATRTGRSWVAELNACSQALHREVALQQDRVAELRELLVPHVPDGEESREAAFAIRAAEFLRASLRLAGQLDSTHDRLRQQASQWIALSDLRTDETTGLANRRELETILELLLAIRKRYQQALSLVLVAVDGDRNQSDVESPAERLLDAVTLIAREIRDSDVAAVLDGATFAVVLPQTPLEGAAVFCHRLRTAAKGLHGQRLLTLTMGMVSANEDDNPVALLDRASVLLREALSAGGDCLRCRDPSHQPAVETPLNA